MVIEWCISDLIGCLHNFVEWSTEPDTLMNSDFQVVPSKLVAATGDKLYRYCKEVCELRVAPRTVHVQSRVRSGGPKWTEVDV